MIIFKFYKEMMAHLITHSTLKHLQNLTRFKWFVKYRGVIQLYKYNLH